MGINEFVYLALSVGFAGGIVAFGFGFGIGHYVLMLLDEKHKECRAKETPPESILDDAFQSSPRHTASTYHHMGSDYFIGPNYTVCGDIHSKPEVAIRDSIKDTSIRPIHDRVEEAILKNLARNSSR